MYRTAYKQMLNWVNRPDRKPLLIRGARQIGKTFLVEQFGREHFQSFVSVNLEFQPEFVRCFDDLDPQQVLNKIQALSHQQIVVGQTLLFIDEIQVSPQAIKSLRYFKELLPDLHVVAAGSLLEFAIRQEDLSMPVGRVEYLYLRPLSFVEYLTALNRDVLIDEINQATLAKPVSDVVHEELLRQVREYMFVGGMPAVVNAYRLRQDWQEVSREQTIILTTYRDDFGKYAEKFSHKYLQRVFEKTPGLVGSRIKYVNIDENYKSRELKVAISDLADAGVIEWVRSTAATGLSLIASSDDKFFKLIFVDTGLACQQMRINFHDLLDEDLTLVNKGALAEQWVGQELMAYTDRHEKPEIFFWKRDKAGSMAEVDYIITHTSEIIPIEVKAGKTGSLRSLRILMQERQLSIGMRVSEKPLSMNNDILSVPFYMLSQIDRLIEAAKL